MLGDYRALGYPPDDSGPPRGLLLLFVLFIGAALLALILFFGNVAVCQHQLCA
jgi:hypothetical protein